MSTTAASKVTKARTTMVMAHPFFGTLALRLKLEQDTKIETASCDGVTLRYNPKFVDELTQPQVQGLIAHEVLHPAFLHHTRRGNRDVKKWNKACDHVINNILNDAKFQLPSGTYADTQYAGMSAEHVYSLLPDDENDDKNGNDPGGDGAVADSPNSQSSGASQSQQNHEESEWKVAVSQAAHVAKQSGKLPSSIERMLEELMQAQLPWRAILRRFMTETCIDDFSWRRGNRRFLANNLYLPSRTSEDSMGEMVVVIDTSGSIGDKELNEFGSEIAAIIEDVRPTKTIVMYCDSKIAHIDEFEPHETVSFAAHGGGGTDFRPPFAWIEEHGLSPRALVYLTDGYGPFPEEEPTFPTLWVINNHDVTPPHGEHLILEVN